MRVSSIASVQEVRERALWLYRIRFAAVAVLIPVLSAANFKWDLELQIIPLAVIGLVEIGLNFPYRFFLKNSDAAFKFLATSVMVDFIAETLAIHFMGGIDALFFSAIYLLTILYCALNLPSSFNFIMATLASIFYAGIIAAECL